MIALNNLGYTKQGKTEVKILKRVPWMNRL